MGTTRFLRQTWVGLGLMVAIAGLWARLSASPAIATDPAATLPEMTQWAIATLPQPLPSPPRGDLRIAIISDLNSAYGSTDDAPEVDRAVALLPAWRPDVVLCSGDMVQQVITNLIGNACRYTPDGSITLTLTALTPRHTCRSRYWAVADTSGGIAEDAMPLSLSAFTAKNAPVPRLPGALG